MSTPEERRVVSIRTPTAYNLLVLVNRDLARRKRAETDISVTMSSLLSRARQIVNETEMLYYEEIVREEEG